MLSFDDKKKSVSFIGEGTKKLLDSRLDKKKRMTSSVAGARSLRRY